MIDGRLRELERRWAESGAPEDEAACLVERLRLGRLGREALELAAARGDLAARLACRALPRAVLVLHFCASWNLLDRFVTETLEELRPLYPGLWLQRCDVDEDRALTASLQIVNVPTLIAFEAGAERARLVEAARRDRLQDWLHQVSA